MRLPPASISATGQVSRLAAMADLKPAYLIHGDDEVKLDSWRHRLRTRAETEGPSTTLEAVSGERLTPAAFAEATGALTLSVGRRYVLADGAERWKEKELGPVIEALKALPPETVVLLIVSGKVTRRRGEGVKGPAPAALIKAVEAVGGEVQVCPAPTAAKFPPWIAERGSDL